MVENNKIITIGIPAYKAQSTIRDLLGSIHMQSVKDKISIVIANDWPGDSYNFVTEEYPDLDITIVDTDKNYGPGLARQHALDACKTEWITFMDADDVLMSPFSIESLINNITPNCIEVQGPFFQEVKEGSLNAIQKQQIIQSGRQIPPRAMPRNDVGHPWVFGRCYNVRFLRENKISFSELRAMED